MLKKFLIGTFAVAVLAFAMVASAAYDFGTTTLRVGSTGEAVMNVQTVVGASVDGKFGPMTKAKVMAWQSNNGLVADGAVGPMTKAAMNGTSVVTSTCPAGQFDPMTGLACGEVSTLPAGCMAGYAFSATTGVACVAGTVPADTTFTGDGEGKLTSFEENAPEVTEASENGVDEEVLNVSFDADNADQKITRIDVDFQAEDSTQSDKPWDYFTEVSLVFNGSVVATADAASSSDWDRTDETTSYDTWSIRFSNLDLVIKDNATANLAVAVSSLSNVDGNDEGQSWEVAIPTNGIRAISPNGLSETYPTTELNEDFTVAGSDAGTLVWSTNADNPDAKAISLDATVDTNGVVLALYDVEADNQDILVEDVVIEVTGTTTGTANQVSDFVQTFHLYADGDLVSSESASTATDIDDVEITFSNVNFTVEDGKTVTFKVTADFQPLDGTIVKAADTFKVNIDASDTVAEQASGGNTGDSITVTGDITGQVHALFVDAPEIALVSAVLTKTLACDGVCAGGEAERAEAVITYTVKAVGADVYLPDELVEDADESDTTYGTGSTYFLKEGAGTEPTATALLTTTNASTDTNGWVVRKGETKTFKAYVTITAAADGYQSVGMSSIEWNATSVAGGSAKDYTYSMQPDWTTNSIYLEFTAA